MVRSETAADVAGIWRLHAAAFPTPAEANLVTMLRDAGDAVFSMVALADDQVVGHALLSKMRSPPRWLGLAPVAVLAPHRNRGIGDNLVRAGLAAAMAGQWDGVFVLGGDYYERFGFDPAAAVGFSSPYAGPHFMALALRPNTFATREGAAEYPRAFSELG